jgi:hypothetical protein
MGFNISTARLQHSIVGILRNGPVALIIGVALVSFSYSSVDQNTNLSGISTEKEFGGFYKGITVQESNIANVIRHNRSLANPFNVISIDDTLKNGPEELQRELSQLSVQNTIVPVINLVVPENVRGNISKDLLQRYANVFRSYGSSIFIHPQMSEKEGAAYVSNWQYLYTFFNDLGISNLTWVWNAGAGKENKAFYPGSKFVDWVGVSCLNYGQDPKHKEWYSFKEIYLPYRAVSNEFQKPVMITELGCLNSKDQSKWIAEAFKVIADEMHEIKGLVIFNDKKVFGLPEGSAFIADFTVDREGSSKQIASSLQEHPFDKAPLTEENSLFLKSAPVAYHSPFVEGKPGSFSIKVNNKDFYIRGVAYNTGHDWRDGNMPLTRKRLEEDFKNIKAMGANTIRRYDHSIYDRNVLNIASEYDLKVLYGFWFDPKVDYYRDTNRVKEYMAEVEKQVLEFRDHPSVLAWSLGNETWGLLKHKYSKPYLTKVRQNYVYMVELLARKIHAIDPTRPVFTSIEHEEYQLPGELVAFHDNAPSIDVMGINSYYQEQVSKLNHTFFQFDSLRPYLISEFGPRGYWDPHYNRTAKGSLIEDTENEKAEWYSYQWKNYVSAFRGYNIGGFAYCWHDRMEGSYTWFGISDYQGRLKPSYYALKESWTGVKDKLLPVFSINAPEEMIAGKEYKVSVSASATVPGLEYEWFLLKDEYLDKVENVESIGDGSSAIITIPEEPSNYRLYLYVSDGSKNTSTASVPILVE